MLLRCRNIRFSVYSHHRCYTRRQTFSPRCASRESHPSPPAKTRCDCGTATFAEEKLQNYIKIRGVSSAVPNLDYEILDSINFTGIIGKVESMGDLLPRTMVSPELASSPSENLANCLASNSTTAGTVTSAHIGLDDDNASGYNGIDDVKSCGMSRGFCNKTVCKTKTTLDLSAMVSTPDVFRKESGSYTHPPENAHSILADIEKHADQGTGPPKVNEEFPSRDGHAAPLAVCGPDLKSSLPETHDVNQGVSSSLHHLCKNMSSRVFSAASPLHGITLPSQLGKRNSTSTGMCNTQSQSRSKTATGSGNPNQSQPTQNMIPFDICDRSLGASSPPKSKVVSVKKQVTDGTGEILRPGMVLLRNYIPLDEQIKIVRLCQSIGLGVGGFYQPRFDSGCKLHLQMMCLGLDWDPQTKKYADMRRLDGARAPAIPDIFISLTKKAIGDSHDLIKADLHQGNPAEILPHMHPNICIVNFYNTSGRLGLHQDKDESRESLQKGLPVVSISLGDSCVFLYGDQRGLDKADKVLLESGDVLIFGGGSRHIFHGVESIIPDSAPAALQQATKLRPGRLNLTLREF